MMIFFSKQITKTENFLNGLGESLKTHNINYEFLNNTNDIWLRDFMPVQVGKNQFVQFSMSRDYYQPKDEPLRTYPAPICQELGITPFVPTYNGKPIYLDGGNIIRGHGKAIICEKVFVDNDIPKAKLLVILTEVLQVDQVIIVPQESGDYCGHADGMCRLLNEHTVLVNDYAKAGSNKRFIDRFYGSLTGAGLDILLVPYHPVESRAYNQPATGCYINYLQVGGRIFLPTFGNKRNDEFAIARFCAIFGAANVIAVPSLAVANLGGVLNCLSWEVY